MKLKEHCDFYIDGDTPSYGLRVGDCIIPVNGRFKPRKCEGVCTGYIDTAYKLKVALRGMTMKQSQ